MDETTHRDWNKFLGLRTRTAAFERGRTVTGEEMSERGRLLAAQEIANNPEARKRVEDAYGVEFAKAQYPEAYRNTGQTGIARILDAFRKLVNF